jgi:hypothetical protein
MRPKFLLMVLLVAVLLVAAMASFKRNFHSSPVPAMTGTPVAISTPATSRVQTDSFPPPTPLPVAVQTVTPEERKAGIEAEKDKLSNWEMGDDPQSLSNILADLNSSEKEIRMAAIQAAAQFESTDAIPVLKAQAANDNDPDEKAASLQAANYLALPTVTFTTENAPMPANLVQQAEQRRADSEAVMQAQLQRPAQNSQSPSQAVQN